MNMTELFLISFLLLVIAHIFRLSFWIALAGTFVIMMVHPLHFFNVDRFLTQCVYSAGLWGGFFMLRKASMLYLSEEEQMKQLYDQLITYRRTVLSRLDELKFDLESLKQGYKNTRQLSEIIRAISHAMEFENVFYAFAEKLVSLQVCSTCRFGLINFQSHTIEKYYVFPKDSDSPIPSYNQSFFTDHIKPEVDAIRHTVEDDRIIFYLPKTDNLVPSLVFSGMQEDTIEEIKPLLTPLYMAFKKSSLFETIKSMSLFDGLTHLYQRRYFLVCMEEEIERAKEHQYTFSILMLDIDDFKKYNDRHGHLAGDFILREIGSIIQNVMRKNDLAGRYGGEEFIFFLPNTAQEGAASLAKRLCMEIENHPFKVSGFELYITVSIGGATYPADGASLTELIVHADKNLYMAKVQGKNRVVIGS